MNIVTYDNSFEGLMTAVFEIYEYKISSLAIFSADKAPGSLFGSVHSVHTDEAKAKRVLDKLKQKLSPNAVMQLYKTFLSELPGIEDVLLRYIQYALSSRLSIENDFSNADVLMIQQTTRKVDRERHRMTAFIRFQCTKDNLFFAIIQPDFNVLPLILKHFKNRYADQRWLIYDSTRKVGLYYDLNTVEEVSLQFDADLHNKDELAAIYEEDETLYQSLWQKYFQAVNIKARKNLKLHIQHMPRRYWKHLTEKQGY